MDDANPKAPSALPRLLRGRRIDWVKAVLALLPFLCLAAYWADAGLPLPAFLLPARIYLALGRDSASAPVRGRETFTVLPDRLAPVATGAERPDIAPLEPVLRDLEGGLGPFRKARLVLDQVPLAGELEALARAAGPVPLEIQVEPRPAAVPLQALSVRYAPLESRVAFDLLLGEEARAGRAVEVRSREHVLFREAGSRLPADGVLRLSVDRTEAQDLTLAFEDAAGRRATRRLGLGVDAQEPPKVLIISEKTGRRSFLETLYPCRRATAAEAAGLDLLSFELVVLDGIPLRTVHGRLLEGLLDLVERRTGSLLLAADSPDFGKKGDNPELESLLPVTLLPRSLKDMPDLAVLILLDVSGSMFGDKLSLAKVTGLELLRNLKPSDRVGMLLFSDTRHWAYDFQANGRITAAPELQPITAEGGTDLAPALAEGLDRLAQESIKAKHVVLITDGITKPADFQALADRARNRGISITTMGVGADVNRPLLERLALQTSGRYYPVGSVDAIPGLLFEDRMSEARAIFGQGHIPVLAMNGEPVATLSGMAQYTPLPSASVLFTNSQGDPLLAGRELGNRAVLLFASDLYGTYTKDFFARPAAAGALKDRLDALFSRRPAEVRVVESARGLSILAQSDHLAAPTLVLSRAGAPTMEVPFHRSGPGAWAAEAVPPLVGRWSATLLDRGGSLASFDVAVNGGLGGVRADAFEAFAAYRPRRFRVVHLGAAWLGLFFAASLACTVMLRVKR